MFVLNSEVTIGKLKFSGVNNVVIKRSVFSMVDSAKVIVPSIAKILRNGKADSSRVVTGTQIKEGDEIEIKLGYNGDLKTEFRGFVKRVNINMPLEIECEGFSWLLRRKEVDIFETSITLKDLLNTITGSLESPYKIVVECNAEIRLSNVQLSNINALQALEKIAEYTDDAVSCFFIQPGTLWCGTLYSLYAKGEGISEASLVKYRPGYNAPKENTLNLRNIDDNSAEVTYSKKNSAGSVLMATAATSKKPKRIHKKLLNNIADATSLKELANEQAYRMSYTGYEGRLTGFLQPYCAPADNAYITDPRYPERDGTYLVETTEVIFGIKGARRIVEVGPKVSFAK